MILMKMITNQLTQPVTENLTYFTHISPYTLKDELGEINISIDVKTDDDSITISYYDLTFTFSESDKIDLNVLYNTLLEIANYHVNYVDPSPLSLLRKYRIVSTVINSVLSKYKFKTKEQIDFLNFNIPNIDKIINIIDELADNIDLVSYSKKHLLDNEITYQILKETVSELNYPFTVEINKLSKTIIVKRIEEENNTSID